MDPLERMARINQLRIEADEGRARIAEREAARERDPIAYDDYVMREGRDAGLHYRTQENTAPVKPTYVEMYHDVDDPTHKYLVHNISEHNEVNRKGWDDWVKAHLAIERKGLIAALERDVAEVVTNLRDEIRADRDAGEAKLRREITELQRVVAEHEERRAAVAEVRKEYAGVERERLESALAQRDARINALEERMQILLRFLSLTGIDPPKGL
jgi:hypothetical protein